MKPPAAWTEDCEAEARAMQRYFEPLAQGEEIRTFATIRRVRVEGSELACLRIFHADSHRARHFYPEVKHLGNHRFAYEVDRRKPYGE